MKTFKRGDIVQVTTLDRPSILSRLPNEGKYGAYYLGDIGIVRGSGLTVNIDFPQHPKHGNRTNYGVSPQEVELIEVEYDV